MDSRGPVLVLLLAFAMTATAAAAATTASTDPVPRWEPQDSGVKVSLRGLSVASPEVAWASGENGTILRTTDGGLNWQQLPKIQRKFLPKLLWSIGLKKLSPIGIGCIP